MTVTIPAWLLWTLLALAPWFVLVPWGRWEDRQHAGYFSGIVTGVMVLISAVWTVAVALAKVVAWLTR